MFGISLFFAKGAQPPYGDIFLFLYENIPFFSVFRTPDIRFGFTMVLSLSLLLLITARYVNRFLSVIFLLLILAAQSSIFFSGLAIKGDNISEKYYDRVIEIPVDYENLAYRINNDSSFGFRYVLPLPPVGYGTYSLAGDLFGGQDILGKLIKKPMLYLSESTGISKKTYQVLSQNLKEENYDVLSQFSVGYLILRSDVSCTTCINLNKEKVLQNFDLVYENKTFGLYKVRNSQPIIQSEEGLYKIINPTTYQVNIDGSKTQTIGLKLSFHKDWRVYNAPSFKLSDCVGGIISKGLAKECISDFRLTSLSDLIYLIKEPVVLSHEVGSDGYSNTWHYESSQLNTGTQNLMIIYYPQLLFTLLMVVSIMTLVLITGGIFLTKTQLIK